MVEYRVKNISEALELIKDFKLSGKYNLFRGQSLNWKVRSTLGRLSKNSLNKYEEKLIRLYTFFETEKSLQKYKSNIDWFFAVAQHYGIPTSYIDFTTNIDIAMYFATNSKSNKVGEDCVIVCLNEEDFKSFVKSTDNLYRKAIPPYIARIDVDNLWRLQAQEGCFLFSPIAEIEQLYSFDKIVFPFNIPYNNLTKDDVYPQRKSELEILLDQYFSVEKKILGQKRFEKFSTELSTPIFYLPKLDINSALKANKIHHSWESKEFTNWQYSITEEWTKNDVDIKIEIKLPLKVSIEDQIKIIYNYLTDMFSNVQRKDKLRFDVMTKPKLTKKSASIINRSCLRIWDGMRNLPYTTEEIIKIISEYICLEIHFQNHKKTYSMSGEKLVVLEMTNQYGSITRCHASPSKIISTFRDDLNEILIDDLSQTLSSKILLNINIPNLVFDFNKLIHLFKNELITYQVLYNSEAENPVIFYTPSQITVCGYA